MNNKNALDFDFLDKDSENKKEKNQESEQKTPGASDSGILREEDKTSFGDFFRAYYRDFAAFCKKHLTKKDPKYFIGVAWIVGMGLAVDRIPTSDISSWGEAWVIVICGGILAALVAYWIQGWFYNVRIGWSGGTLDENTGKHVWLYSMLPIGVVNILWLLLNHIGYGESYFGYYGDDLTAVDIIFFFLTVAAIGYSIAISYKAVRSLSHAKKGPAIWWFIVAPALLYIAVFVAAMLS